MLNISPLMVRPIRQFGPEAIELIESIRNLIPREEFDYQMLLDALAEYARPRDKITQWLNKGVIVRIKKGLYVFGDGLRRKPYSRELLANLIYGPSYLSLEWALQHYGLIPERVEALTSVTTGRSRKFRTPAGLFVYRQIPLQAFRTGMTRVEIDGVPAFLVATREKAIADKIRQERGAGIGSPGGDPPRLGTNRSPSVAGVGSPHGGSGRG